MWFYHGGLSLRSRLIWIIMLTCGVVLGLSGTGIALNDFYDGKRNILNRLSIQANIVGAHCKSALVFGDRQAAEQTLAALSAEPSIAAAQLFAEDGALFASYLNGQLNDDNVIAFPQLSEAWFNDPYLHVFHPVVLDGEKIGTVYLLGNLQIIYIQLRQQLLMTVSILLASYVVAFFYPLSCKTKFPGPFYASLKWRKSFHEITIMGYGNKVRATMSWVYLLMPSMRCWRKFRFAMNSLSSIICIWKTR